VINGLAYSFLWVGMVVFINEITKDRGATTMMALYTVTLPALTQMVSGPFSGLIFDRFGAYWLYAIGLVGSLLAWVVLSLGNKKGSD
jgi:MFS family permease